MKGRHGSIRAAVALVVLILALQVSPADARKKPIPSCDTGAVRNEPAWTTIEVPPYPLAGTPPGEGASSVQRFGVDQLNPNVMFVTNGQAVQKTTDGGCHWEQVFDIAQMTGTTTLPLDLVTAIGVVNPERVYLVLGNVEDRVTVVQTNDGGKTWTQQALFVGWSGSDVSIAVSPNDPDFAALSFARGSLFFGIPVLMTTHDAGKTWNEQLLLTSIVQNADPASFVAIGPNTLEIKIDPLDPKELWAAPFRGQLLHSSDAGATWTGMKMGDAAVKAENFDLFHRPGEPTHIVVARGSGGFIRSDDGGSSWATVAGPEKDGFNILGGYIQFGSSPDNLFVASGQKLFRWEQRLQKWMDISASHEIAVGNNVYSAGSPRRLIYPSYGMDIQVFRGRV